MTHMTAQLLQLSFDCSFERKTLRCSLPFRFRELSAGSATLVQDRETGPTFSCGCGSASCEVEVAADGSEISCTENQCHGNWGWRVSVPGLSTAFLMLAR
jgi:hypothetical protein